MKTILFLLFAALLVLTSCRNGRGGPAERAGRGVDNAVDWAGYGVRRAGESIQRAAR
jgi:predicted small secreted protein